MKKISLILLSGLMLCMPGQAQSLNDYLLEAGNNNPELKARFSEYEAALQKEPQAGALPDPELSFSFFLRPMERFMGNQVGDVALMQMFPWAGSQEAGRNEAKYMAQMKFYTFADARNNLFHSVNTAYYQLYQNTKEAGLLQQELEILKILERVALVKYEAGTAGASSQGTQIRTAPPAANLQGSSGRATESMGGMGAATGSGSPAGSSDMSSAGMGGSGNMAASGGSGMVDVLLLRIRIRELENRISLLHQARRLLVVTFNNLLNRPPELPVLVADTLLPVPLPAALSVLADSVRLNHPVLKMYEWDQKAKEAQQQMARLMGRPMIGAGLNYMVFRPRYDEMLGRTMGGENMLMPMVTVTLPIYRKKYNAAQKEAMLLQQAAAHQKQSAENMLLTELESLLYDYQRSASLLELTGEQVTLTEQAARLMTTGYTVGNTGIEELVRQRQSLISFRQQQLQAITDQHIAVSAINRMTNLVY